MRADRRGLAAADAITYSTGASPIIVGRTPLLPIDVCRELLASAGPEAAALRLLAAEPLAMLALFVASPSLYAALEQRPSSSAVPRDRAPLRALAYALRMSSRPTPFGFFAGVGHVEAGRHTTLSSAAPQRMVTRTRPDMEWLMAVAKSVERRPEVRTTLRWHANELVLARGGRIYVMNPEGTRTTGPQASYVEYTPTSLRSTPAVQRLMQAAGVSGATRAQLESIATQEFELPQDRAAKLVDGLRDAGVLLSELRPSLVGDPVAALSVGLRRVAPDVAAQVDGIVAALEALDGISCTARSVPAYRAVDDAMRALHSQPPARLHVDTAFPFDGTLGEDVVREVERLAGIMLRCARTFTLEAYRRRFFERYESADRIVPLLELVDPDFGIGPPNDLASDEATRDEARDSGLVDLAVEATRDGAIECRLSDDRLDALVGALPARETALDSFELGVQVAAKSVGALECGEFDVMPAALFGTDCAGKSAGRFLELLGTTFSAELGTRLDAGDAIAVDLSYLPHDARAANVAIRPPSSPFELQVGLHATVGDGRTRIQVGDLVVGLSGRRFAVYSRSMDRELTIRELHLLNTPRSAPNVCRFLGALRADGRRMIVGFDWGRASRLPYLPRLRFGRLVLSRARWLLPHRTVRGSIDDARRALAAWVDRWRPPAQVCIVADDLRLPIDLSTAAAADLLQDQTRTSPGASIVLEELLPALDDCWLERDGRRFASEFLVSFFASGRKPPTIRRRLLEVEGRDRIKTPDSEWVYAKFYAGKNQADSLLRDAIGPAVGRMRLDGAIDRWFFVRYADDGPHLRVRFRKTPAAGHAAFESVLIAARGLVESKAVERYCLDTYVREVERYGGVEGMDAAETIFAADSDRALAWLCAGSARTADRLAACARSAAALVDGLFPGDDIDLWLSDSRPKKPKLSPDRWAIVKRLESESPGADATDDALRVAARSMRELALEGSLTVTLIDVARSLFHMHCNRFGVEGDAEELMLALQWHWLYGRRERGRVRP